MPSLRGSKRRRMLSDIARVAAGQSSQSGRAAPISCANASAFVTGVDALRVSCNSLALTVRGSTATVDEEIGPAFSAGAASRVRQEARREYECRDDAETMSMGWVTDRECLTSTSRDCGAEVSAPPALASRVERLKYALRVAVEDSRGSPRLVVWLDAPVHWRLASRAQPVLVPRVFGREADARVRSQLCRQRREHAASLR